MNENEQQGIIGRRAAWMITAAAIGLCAQLPATTGWAQPTDYQEFEEEEEEAAPPPADAPPPVDADVEARQEGAQEAEAFEPSFSAGSVDLLLTAGFGAFLYPHIELGVDIGVVPLPEDITISFSVAGDLGYCVLCAGLSALSTYNVQSYYITIYGRALAHLGILSRLAKLPELDPYLGVQAGPTTFQYQFTLDNSDAEALTSQWLVSAGPLLGVRYMLNDTFLVFGEVRYLLSLGYSNASVNIAGETYVAGDNYANRGTDYLIGIGARF